MSEERAGGLPLKGLAQGMATTLATMFRRVHTAQYPDVEPELPPRSRGAIALFEENCTVCMLCARECPDWCIYIDSHKETTPATTPGGRDRSRNVLDRFAIDFSLCMYCGICVEVCPFDALFWSPEFEYSEPEIADLTHEKDRLREWMWTVPPPPAHDPGGEPDKALDAAQKTATIPAGGAPARTPPARTRPATATEPASAADTEPASAAEPPATHPAPGGDEGGQT